MDKVSMDMTEKIFAFAVVILYPFFFGKLTNYIMDNKKIDSMCKDSEYGTKCWEIKDNERQKIEFKKHIMLIIIAIIGIVLSGVVSVKSTKLGLGIGGLITLVYAMLMYWRHYDEGARVAILGASFLFVIWLSVRLYKVKNVADVFTMEYGTK